MAPAYYAGDDGTPAVATGSALPDDSLNAALHDAAQTARQHIKRVEGLVAMTAKARPHRSQRFDAYVLVYLGTCTEAYDELKRYTHHSEPRQYEVGAPLERTLAQAYLAGSTKAGRAVFAGVLQFLVTLLRELVYLLENRFVVRLAPQDVVLHQSVLKANQKHADTAWANLEQARAADANATLGARIKHAFCVAEPEVRVA